MALGGHEGCGICSKLHSGELLRVAINVPDENPASIQIEMQIDATDA